MPDFTCRNQGTSKLPADEPGHARKSTPYRRRLSRAGRNCQLLRLPASSLSCSTRIPPAQRESRRRGILRQAQCRRYPGYGEAPIVAPETGGPARLTRRTQYQPLLTTHQFLFPSLTNSTTSTKGSEVPCVVPGPSWIVPPLAAFTVKPAEPLVGPEVLTRIRC